MAKCSAKGMIKGPAPAKVDPKAASLPKVGTPAAKLVAKKAK